MERYDTLLHLSSETETPFRSINNFLIYYLMLTGGGTHNQLSYISMNSLAVEDIYDCGIAKFPMQNIDHWEAPENFTNYRSQYLQGFWEVKAERDYVGVSLKTAYPISETYRLEGLNGNWCHLTKYRRYLDSKEFYFIQLTQTFGGYLNPNSYKAVSELLQYIKEHFPGLYIIVGDFNVHGHEKIFEHYLGSKDYHICPFYKSVTCNDNEGLGSPDGIVVARELYPRIEYAVDFYPGYSYQHFIISAKMYPTTHFNGTYDATSPAFKHYLQLLKNKHGDRDYFIGNKGIFDENDGRMTGSIDSIQEVYTYGGGPKTYTAPEMASKLDKIEL